MSLRLVALTGPARSGKTRAARVLADFLGSGPALATALVGFADGLKRAAAELVPDFDPEQEGDKLREVLPGVTGRQLLERLGTDFARSLHEDVFVRALEARLEGELDDADYVIVQDLRFANEAAWVRGRGGIVVQTTRLPAGPNGGDANHPSQRPLPLDCVDYYLENLLDDAHTAAHWRWILRDKGWLAGGGL